MYRSAKEISVIRKRQKLWDIMGFVYRSKNELRKRHSLNCGCGMCRFNTFIKRAERRKERHSFKQKRFDYEKNT